MNTRNENDLNNEQSNSMRRPADKEKKFLLASIVLVLLLSFSLLAAAWTPVTPPPYDLEYARTTVCNILPEFVEGNTPQTTPGLMSFTENYGTGGFTVSGEDSEWFDFYVDPEDSTKVFRVLLGTGDLGVIHILEWEAVNIDVEHVLVKGGDNYFAYNYPDPCANDKQLLSPRVGGSDQGIADISHFTVIFTSVTDVTDETEETTDATTEETTEATTADATIDIVDETLPLASVTTEETTEATTAVATIDIEDETLPLAGVTTDETTSQTTIVIDDDEIPQTGESTASVVVGAVLLAMAGSLVYILRKVRNQG